MRKFTLLIAVWFTAILSFSQAPASFSYQSVIRDAQGELLVTTSVGINVSILKDATDGTVVYSETHQPVTNDNGLVTLQIGAGTTSNDFSSIDWGDGTYFVKTEIDIEGGSDYTISSVSQLLSVPYALYAESAGNVSGLNELKSEVALMKHTMSAGGYVEDIDGNQYNTVKIGDQIWMAENLRTTTYNDGTVIPLITDDSSWGGLTTPGYGWYDMDKETYSEAYGALYNGFVVETGKLCPSGWHVPSDEEWKELEMVLGMSMIDADLRSTDRGTDQGAQLANNNDLWVEGILCSNPNFGTSGFNALPAGHRNHINGGLYSNLGTYTYWWTRTVYDSDFTYIRQLQYDKASIIRNAYKKTFGFSVRCVKD